MSYQVIDVEYQRNTKKIEETYEVYAVYRTTEAPFKLISTWILKSDAEEEADRMRFWDLSGDPLVKASFSMLK